MTTDERPTSSRHRRTPAAFAAALALTGALAASALTCATAAQTLRPVAPPTPVAPALPPALSQTEQRFRDLAAYIRQRGTIDAGLRADIVRLAADLDAAIAASDTTDAQRMRLLPARAQTAVWLLDPAAIDAAF